LTIVDQLVVSLSHWRRIAGRLVSSLQRKLPRRGGPARARRRKSTLPCRQPLVSECAAMSSGVGGGGASFS
jgi:hypothetical protein